MARALRAVAAVARSRASWPAAEPGRVRVFTAALRAPLTRDTGALQSPGSLPARSLGHVALAPPPAAAAPLDAAAIRELDVKGVVEYVKSLGVSSVGVLESQEVDGAALLETTVDELRSCGLPLGCARTIMRAVSPAVAAAQIAVTVAPVAEQSATLTFFSPKAKGRPNNPLTVRLTPAKFERMFDVLTSPLRITNTSGSVLGFATSLADAVDASRSGQLLLASRRYDDDLASLLGFVGNCATAFEITSTRALAADEQLIRAYGPLELVNSGEEVKLHQSRRGGGLLELAPDGLVVSRAGPSVVVLFNSAKLTPSEAHVDELLEDARVLEAMLADDWANVTSDPPAAKAQLLHGGVGGAPRVVPFLSGNIFGAADEVRCADKGVGVVRPSGEGFLVRAPPLRGGS